MKRLLIAFVVLISVVPISPVVTSAQPPNKYWNWSPDAKHHSAFVQIQTVDSESSKFTGSGVYISYKGLHGVLTAKHVIHGSRIQVVFSNGMKVLTSGTVDREGNDVAFIFVSNPRITPVPIATVASKVGDKAEFLAGGGPTKVVRHFYGEYTAREFTEHGGKGKSREIIKTHVVPGDSGSGIFNGKGEVVGVLSTAGEVQEVGNWGRYPIWKNAGSVRHKDILAFLDRIKVSKNLPKVGQKVGWFR